MEILLFINGKKERREGPVNSITKIALGFGTAIAGFFLIKKLVNVGEASNTAEKLTYDIEGVKIKKIEYFSGLIPKGVIYTFDLQLNNPTSKELIISKLYIKVSLPDGKGSYSRVANTSEASVAETKIKANANTRLSLDIEMRFANALPFLPNIISYVIGRLRGIKASQKVLVNATIDSMGITIPIDKVMEI